MTVAHRPWGSRSPPGTSRVACISAREDVAFRSLAFGRALGGPSSGVVPRRVHPDADPGRKRVVRLTTEGFLSRRRCYATRGHARGRAYRLEQFPTPVPSVHKQYRDAP